MLERQKSGNYLGILLKPGVQARIDVKESDPLPDRGNWGSGPSAGQ